MSDRGQSNVFSIPPGVAFLPTLVDALMTGRLVEGFAPKFGDLRLADVTIWVPTRRAVRALRDEFARASDDRPALLPAIRPLGEIDDDDLLLSGMSDDDLDGKPVSSLRRTLVLARMIYQWAKTLNDAQRRIHGSDVLMPATFADAVHFSADLARLMDTVATEGTDWDRLKEIDPGELGDWWNLTLDFLKIATTAWPAYLAEQGEDDATVLRARQTMKQAEAYAERPPAGPVIVAGSTGSIPATAQLLATIARLNQGAVVLPGLDQSMSNTAWDLLNQEHDAQAEAGPIPGHPQYGLRVLLKRLDIGRTDVIDLAAPSSAMAKREKLVSQAMLPHDVTDTWLQHAPPPDMAQSAFESVTLLEADNEQEEGLAIALVLRRALAEPGRTAALVTPDRTLARRVAVELSRFGVHIDDSAGMPLRNTTPGTALRLVLALAFTGGDVVNLVGLLKHPLCSFGLEPATARRAARLLELTAIRGSLEARRPGSLAGFVSEAASNAQDRSVRAPAAIASLTEDDWQIAADLAARIDTIFGPLVDGASSRSMRTLAEQTIAALEACAATPDAGLTGLYGTPAGQHLNAFLARLLDETTNEDIEVTEWPAIVEALMGGAVVRSVGMDHPRVAILGPLEARLQTFDEIVLGGLNEKTWPAATRNDPFLSRSMKRVLGLPAPERRTGLAAHDFQTLLGMKTVTLSRSKKVDNAPAVASRWVQRLTMVVGEETSNAMRSRGDTVLQLARSLDTHTGKTQPTRRPMPRPPVDTRPRRLSITEIETWIKDPYALYARHVLKLEGLEPLQREPDARERGTLYHAILEDFFLSDIPEDRDVALRQLLSFARDRFAESGVAEHAANFWWPRFGTIAEAVVDWHMAERANIRRVHVEQKGQVEVSDEFVLSGRADRIDERADGFGSVIDYKTGLNPKIADIKALQAPQLLLEAKMLAEGAFGDIGKLDPANVAYIRLRPDAELRIDKIGDHPKDDLDKLMIDAWAQLEGLVSAYGDPAKDYPSKARQIKASDFPSEYDHLARIGEWMLADDDDGRGET